MRTSRVIIAGAVSTVALFSAMGVSAQGVGTQSMDNGFKSFSQDSCDPLLVGVLTNNGYENADLERLYQVAYGGTVQQACGFVKAGNDSFEFVEPLAPITPDLPPVLNPGNDLVGNVPDLPPLDPIDLPEPAEFDNAVARTSRFYLAAKGAYLFPQDSVITHVNDAPVPSVTGSFTPGTGSSYGGSVAIGYRIDLGDGLLDAARIEGQGSYYSIGVEDLANLGDADVDDGTDDYDTLSDGKETVIGGFANLYLDLGLFDLPFRPYIGGGVGYGQRKTSFTISEAAASGTPEAFTQELSTTGVMYQGMVGVGYDLNDSIGLEIGYKFLRLPAHEATMQTNVDADSFSMGSRDIHMVEGGITFSF